MENRFLNCCHDSLLIGTLSECDRFFCKEGKHHPCSIYTIIRLIMSIFTV